MTSHRTLVACAALGVVVVVAAGSQGAARFTGLRWDAEGSSNPATMLVREVPGPPTSGKRAAAAAMS